MQFCVGINFAGLSACAANGGGAIPPIIGRLMWLFSLTLGLKHDFTLKKFQKFPGWETFGPRPWLEEGGGQYVTACCRCCDPGAPIISPSLRRCMIDTATNACSDMSNRNWSRRLFLPRDAMHKRGLCRHAVSVCLSRSWIMSKRINISSKFFHHRVAPPF